MHSFNPNIPAPFEKHFGGFQGVPPSKLGFVCKPDMPPHINILFRARPPVEFMPLPPLKQKLPYTGIFGNTPDIVEKLEKHLPEKYIPDESKRVKRLKSIVDKIEKIKFENREKAKEWNPKNDENIQGDPYKTLFVYKLDYKTDEKKLKREFEMYGPIKKVRIVRDLEGKSRGYGFIEYEHKSDFKNAYKKSDRKRIDESRVSVDYERARTEKHWKPKRYGGGKGESRPFPNWLEKEVKEIKETFPEIVAKYNKDDEKMIGKKRHKSKSENVNDLNEDADMKSNNEDTHNEYMNMNEDKINVDENNHNDDDEKNGNGNGEAKKEIKYESDDDKNKKRKKEKREKKDKKEKRSKKDKKDRKDKKEKDKKRDKKENEKENEKDKDKEREKEKDEIEMGEII